MSQVWEKPSIASRMINRFKELLSLLPSLTFFLLKFSMTKCTFWEDLFNAVFCTRVGGGHKVDFNLNECVNV